MSLYNERYNASIRWASGGFYSWYGSSLEALGEYMATIDGEIRFVHEGYAEERDPKPWYDETYDEWRTPSIEGVEVIRRTTREVPREEWEPIVNAAIAKAAS